METFARGGWGNFGLTAKCSDKITSSSSSQNQYGLPWEIAGTNPRLGGGLMGIFEEEEKKCGFLPVPVKAFGLAPASVFTSLMTWWPSCRGVADGQVWVCGPGTLRLGGISSIGIGG